MVNKMLEEIQKTYKCKKVDVAEFDSVSIEGSKTHVEAYNAEGLGRVATVHVRGFLGLWKMQSMFVTPLDKDAPIFYCHRHDRKGHEILKIEIINTQLKQMELDELDAVKEKYSHIPEAEDKEEWYDEMKLPATTLKRVKKSEEVLLNQMAEDYFNAYMDVLQKAKECERAQKKQKVDKLVKGLVEKSGMAVVQLFLAYYNHNVANKLCRDILFGLRS